MKNSLIFLNETEKLVIDQFVRFLRAKLGQTLVKIELFGSKAMGNYTETSDIDILIIVKERTLDVMDTVADITAQLNVEFNLSLAPVIFSQQEFRINADMSSPFSLAVEAEGVLL